MLLPFLVTMVTICVRDETRILIQVSWFGITRWIVMNLRSIFDAIYEHTSVTCDVVWLDRYFTAIAQESNYINIWKLQVFWIMCLDHKKPLRKQEKTIQYTGPSSFVIWQRNLDYKARDARRITAAKMKYMRRTAGYIWTDYKTSTKIAKELKITQILEKILECKRKWIQNVSRMSRNR